MPAIAPSHPTRVTTDALLDGVAFVGVFEQPRALTHRSSQNDNYRSLPSTTRYGEAIFRLTAPQRSG